MEEKRFFSVEYVDEDKEIVVKHVFLTSNEVNILLNKFISEGIQVSINDLTPPSVDTATSIIDASLKCKFME